MRTWSHAQLKEYGEKIEALYEGYKQYGFSYYPQEFYVTSTHGIMSALSYTGIPSNYPHWSFGKEFEVVNTKYRYGLDTLPYEMVINSDPCVAYLSERNTLVAQLLTMCHVYGHNDFFKNNHFFQQTDASNVNEKFRLYAERVRDYISDPTIGREKVEKLINAAHSISYQKRKNPDFVKLSPSEEKQRIIEKARPQRSRWSHLGPKQEFKLPRINRIPIEPEEDFLRFIIQYNPILEEWERDVLEIVADRSSYLTPQMQTKIMNEGWATFWHYKMMRELDLPQAELQEFYLMHSKSTAGVKGRLNPYRLGFYMWQNIFDRWENPKTDEDKEMLPGGEGYKKIFQVRRTDRDDSFIRQYLTKELVEELDLFRFDHDGEDQYVVTETYTSEEDSWKNIRDILALNVGSGMIPNIKIIDANYRGRHELLLFHCYDGRDLFEEDTVRTLKHLWTLWRKKIHLLTARLDPDGGGYSQCWSYEVNGEKVKSKEHCTDENCPVDKFIFEGEIDL